eukprot:581606-Karenia_brevis.AAC.1
MSKLLYNVHVWSKWEGVARASINSLYMRVWRRIAGQARFNGNAMSDLKVRQLLNVPSIDCVVRRKRLAYLSRLARTSFHSLPALLQQRDRMGKPLPWVQLVLADLQVLWRSVPQLAELGDP